MNFIRKILKYLLGLCIFEKKNIFSNHNCSNQNPFYINMPIYSLLEKSIQNNEEKNVLFFRDITKLLDHLKTKNIHLIFEDKFIFVEPILLTGQIYFEDTEVQIKIHHI